MTAKPTLERDFEAAIEAWLVERAGYVKADSGQFDAALGLDEHTLLAFLKATQADALDALKVAYGSAVEDAVVKRIAAECDTRGLLDVVRNGVRDRGQHLRLAYFRPPTRLNPDTERRYDQNRLTVMRQVRYDLDSNRVIDMLLSLNGLPIATIELKNAFTGQRAEHAIDQYKKDRVPTAKTPLLQHKKRALVHFAVDTDEAYMTTRLAGDKTFFLPFNAGNDGGKGNADDHHYQTGYKTGYLWEEIWQRDTWLDIIHRFIHLQVEKTTDVASGKTTTAETLIFPRYHQLAAVRDLLADTRAKGAGHNYLIQHSAGSGKTNTISWLAHQLASTHDRADRPIFDSVVVVSDRRNLDKQLQDNIYQIEHKQGVVAKIDEDRNSRDLADELNKGTKIIITTLQKFSFLLDKVRDLSHRNFAVIVDEAHSSQGGQSAGNLRKALGGTRAAESEDDDLPDMEDLILAEAQRRGPQPNISFYAFTATPKHRTLEMFGVRDAAGNPQPFHLYAMRQAIEERFIHDVLAHYTTYKTYYKLSKAIEDDPEVDERKAKKAIARFMSLHPHNLAQKTELMVEHFRAFTRRKINGKAKAMLVTSSRLHAVRYKRAFDKYIAAKGYADLKTLVAFSGSVADPDMAGVHHTEAGMNGIGERELPGRFATPEYQILIVAEKYQTGFDQPLLHTMFVDKRLSDLKAVQTLSRLNRTTEGKVDTFVLDFVNEIDEIKDAFKPYCEQTEIYEPTDPNHLYTLDAKLKSAAVLRDGEIDEFARIYFKPQSLQTGQDHGRLNKWIDPAVERFKQSYGIRNSDRDAYTEEGEGFKSTLHSFVRLYGFLSQIITWQDPGLEKLYAYGRHLLAKLPRRPGDGMLELADEVELSHYRNEKTFAGSGALAASETEPVYGVGDVGTAKPKDDHTAPLSTIIETINERFGTHWTDEDKLLLDQISGDMAQSQSLAEQAKANPIERFKQVSKPEVMRAFARRQGRNQKIIDDFMSNKAQRDLIIDALLKRVYRTARKRY